MPRFIDITGQRFHKLVALAPTGKNSRRMMCWLCQCDCGGTAIVRIDHLRNGHTRSCGCLYEKHGMRHTKTYKSWYNMLQRCSNSKINRWHIYGGRGIKVCERWQDFRNFFADMGERPEDHSLDRINVEGNYEPGNCRWATQKEQQNNRRNNKLRAP